MDSGTETVLLLEIEKNKSTILSKDNSKDSRDKKITSWNRISQTIKVKCGKEFLPHQLQKKWSNARHRLKNKIKQINLTGGGQSEELHDRDRITLRIVGETNPSYTMIPGCYPPRTPSEDIRRIPDEQPTASCSTTNNIPPVDCTPSSRKRPRTDSGIDLPLDKLHRQALSKQIEHYEKLDRVLEEQLRYYSVVSSYYQLKMDLMDPNPTRSCLDDIESDCSQPETSTD